MPIDPNVFDKIKTFTDYNKADQAFQMQKALQNQALQTGGIDAASKANIYKTQVISAATAGMNQNDYDRARQTLQSQGIDISDLAPDVQTAAQQAQAGRLAQSPLGSLISAGAKLTGNDLQAVNTYGSMEAAVKAGYKPEGLNLPNIGSYSGMAAPSPAAPIPQAAPAPQAKTALPPPSVAKANPTITDQTPSGQGALANMYDTTPAQPVVLTPQANAAPNPTPAASVPKFIPPDPVPGDSASETQRKQNMAFEQFKLNNAAAINQANTIGTKTGENIATANADAIKSSETANRLKPNFEALRAVNNDVPDATYGVPPDVKAWASAANPFGDHKAATANAAWKMVNEQQVLNALSQLVSGGQIKSNRQIARMLETGNFVPSDIDAPDRLTLINTLENESKNQATSAGNIAARLQGQPTQPYVQTMPSTGVSGNTPMVSTQAQFDALPSGAVYMEVGTDGKPTPMRKP